MVTATVTLPPVKDAAGNILMTIGVVPVRADGTVIDPDGPGQSTAVTIADGADVAQGTTTDAAWTSGAGTVVGILKAVVAGVLAMSAKLPATLGIKTSAASLSVAPSSDGVFPSSQSGTWTVQPGNTANTTAWKVDGSAVTQPVSGTITANLGTLNGAATAAKQPALGTAGTASTDVLTVQGIASGTSLNVVLTGTATLSADGQSAAAAQRVNNFATVFNGSTWDRARGDTVSAFTRQPPQAGTDRSITATTTSQTLAASNTTRSKLLIRNDTTIDIWVNIGATAVATAGSGNFKVAANGGEWELLGSTSAVNIIAASGTPAITAREF